MNTTQKALRFIVWHDVNSTKFFGQIRVERVGSEVDAMSTKDAAKWFANEQRLHRVYPSAMLLTGKIVDGQNVVARLQNAYRLMMARKIRNNRNHYGIPMKSNGVDIRELKAVKRDNGGWKFIMTPLESPRTK